MPLSCSRPTIAYHILDKSRNYRHPSSQHLDYSHSSFTYYSGPFRRKNRYKNDLLGLNTVCVFGMPHEKRTKDCIHAEPKGKQVTFDGMGCFHGESLETFVPLIIESVDQHVYQLLLKRLLPPVVRHTETLFRTLFHSIQRSNTNHTLCNILASRKRISDFRVASILS